MGMIYIQGEDLVGEKLPGLATLYLLILKLIYDEQMENVSASVNVYTTLGAVHEKLGNYRLLNASLLPAGRSGAMVAAAEKISADRASGSFG